MAQPVGTIRVARVSVTCENCGRTEEVVPWKARANGGRRFCSNRCANLVTQKIRYAATPTDWTNFANRYRRENDVGTVCRICGEEEFSVSLKRHHLDHDHKTGKVRGLLCQGCNLRLGWYEKHAEAIHEYLEPAA